MTHHDHDGPAELHRVGTPSPGTHPQRDRPLRPPDEGEPIPALLRGSRAAYGTAIQRRLTEAGIDDVPRNGPYVLGGMGYHGGFAGRLAAELGVSKQAASQLVDTLVVRGYLERRPDPEDRRRVSLSLTERGQAAAQVVRDSVQEVDAELARRVPPEQLAGLRAGLAALCCIREEMEHPGRQGDSHHGHAETDVD
jgi:DNA-binding MarR family transcriptional regulator